MTDARQDKSAEPPRTFTCELHHRVVPIEKGGDGCRDCVAFLNDPPDPASMPGSERRAEMEHWCGILTAKFALVRPRIEALVGREVWTHEMASSNVERLFEEAESWNHPDDLLRHGVDLAADFVGAENVYVYPEAPAHE